MKYQNKHHSLIAIFIFGVLALVQNPRIGSFELIKSAEAATSSPSIKSTQITEAPPVALSSNGSLLATYLNGIVRVHDVLTGNLIWEYVDELNQRVSDITFSPNGKMLAISGKNGINLRNAASGKQLGSLGAHNSLSDISDITVSQSGSLVAGKNAENMLYVWDLKSGTAKIIQPGTAKNLTKISFSPDEKYITGSFEEEKAYKIKIFNTANGKVHAEFNSAVKTIDFAYSPDGLMLASADQKGLVNILDASTGNRLRIIDAQDPVTAIAYSSDSRYVVLASQGVDTKIQIWNLKAGELLSSQQTLDNTVVSQLVTSTDTESELIAAIGADHRIFVLELPSGEVKQIFSGQTQKVIESKFNNQDSVFAAVGADGQLTVWDLLTGAQKLNTFLVENANNTAAFQLSSSASQGLAGTSQQAATNSGGSNQTSNSGLATKAATTISAPLNSGNQNKKEKIKSRDWKGVKALAVSDDGLEMAISSDDGSIHIVKNDGKERWQVKGHHGDEIRSIAYRGKSKEWVSAGKDTEIKVWNSATGNSIKTYLGLEHPSRAVTVSPDGKFIAAGGEETRIFIYDAEAGKLSKILKGHTDFVNGLSFDSKSQVLASAGAEGRVLIWDVVKGELKFTLLGHAGEVNSVAFSPDGGLIASASQDSTVILWNAVTGQKIKSLTGHQGAVRTVAFSPDGKKLVSAGEDTKLLEWNPASGQLLKQSQGSTGMINALVFNPNGDLHIADDKNEVAEIKVDTGAKVKSIAISKGAVTSADSDQSSTEIAENDAGSYARSALYTAVNKLIDWVIPAANAAIPAPPGGPILVLVNDTSGKIGRYYTEILRTEGLNEFDVSDISTTTDVALQAALASYDVVILAQTTLTASQVTILTNWVNGGGNLIAMRPDTSLAGLMGLTSTGSTLANAYMLVDTSALPGNGIVNQTIQFHGTADRYTLSGATSVATLYSNATTATTNPAVTLRTVGALGGQAAAFTYDLATSIVQTRQGNPAWATQERDGFAPIRSDDKFYGNAAGDAQADWIDLNKVAIPQADEQQRLLVNLILEMNKDKKPLPRFWYLPRDLKAAVIMTGDDHANNGTEGRFNDFISRSTVGCSVQDWECIRGTSYIFDSINTASLTPAEASTFNSQGFEVGLHINTNCADYTPAQLESFYVSQLGNFTSKYPGIPAPITQRHHCIAWSDWVTGAKVQLNHGIRFDTSYYFWPPSWVNNVPGIFTGSVMPMRFTDTDGSLIDVYEAASQMTDESGQSYPFTINTLLDRAIGSEGYYGAYTINAHTDIATQTESDTTVVSAQARGVPVITSRQMMDWLDAKNNSSFSGMTWSGNTLSFTINSGTGGANVPQGDKGLKAHLPLFSKAGALSGLTRSGSPVTTIEYTVKGVTYASFTAAAGNYVATYAVDNTAPTIIATSPTVNATGVDPGASVTATFSEAMDSNTISSSTFELRNPGNSIVSASISYNASTRIATLRPSNTLSANTTYTVTVKGGATDPRVKDLSGNALAANSTWTFTTGAQPCSTSSCSAWSSSTVPGTPAANDPSAVNLGVKFKSDLDGVITGIRFYQTTTGVNYTGSLWATTNNQQLASGTITATASGWQQITFGTPVAITAGQIYVASYLAPNGNYAVNGPSLAAGVDNSPIHLLADGVSGGNGVYAYSTSPILPTNTFGSSNYWVDVVFSTNTGPDTTAPTVTGNTPAANATNVAVNSNVTVTFSEAMDATTITGSTFELRNASNALVAASVSYNAATRIATLTPNAALSTSTTYTAKLVSGTSGVKDNSSNHNPLAANFSWSFTTAASVATGCSGATESIWPSNPTPSTVTDSDTASVELGVKFRSSANGVICGIRFYKGSANTGTHVVKLYDSAGLLLASKTLLPSDETASGWQSINFDSPVTITPGAQYVASYLAPVGRYSADSNYFSTSRTSGSLYAFSNAESGGNGVYQYGTGGYPNNTFGSSNYWVDVIFTSNTGPDTTAPTVSITSPSTGATGVIPTNPVSVTFSEPMNAATISAINFTLSPAVSGIVLNYDSASRTARLTPASNSPLASNTTYTATVKGGSSGVTDVAGNPLVVDRTFTFTTGVDPCSIGGNAIVCENAKTGNPSSEWDVAGGSTNIEGFATDISVNRGSNVQFKIDSKLANYHLDIYRMGYYNGLGARKIATITTHAGVSQPACFNQTSTGLIDCGNWSVTDTWSVPATTASGIYFAKATIDSGANTGQASHVFFIVRDDASTSDILFQTSDTTWQAYNNWGGNSFYGGTGPGTGGNSAGRAYKVSYNRPFNTRNVDGGQDWVFNAEYPMVRWLEANGYNVSYFTGIDSDRNGALIKNHKIFLSVGHDEYWSKQQRANVEAARDAATNPVNLIFMSGNEVFWKTRWENNITSNTGTLGPSAYRTLVCSKETHNYPNNIDTSTTQWLGTFRDPRGTGLTPQKLDGGNPENSLTGILFMVNDGATTSIQVPEEDGKLRLWRNTSIASLATGTTFTLPNGTLGYEWDIDVDNGFRPGGLIHLSTTTVPNAPVLTDNGSTFGSATVVHSLDMYKAASGAKVFGAGTVQWSWGLDSNHDRAGTPTDANMQQATVNLLADMGVQPGNLQSGLVAATVSTDTSLPNSAITSPASGAAVATNTTVNVTGTAADTGGSVAGVEVSVNGGAWHPATGRGSWTYSFTAPSTNGTLTIRSRAIDDSLNLEIPGAGRTINVGTGADTTAPSIPASLTATVISGAQVNLDWTDSTDNVAVTRYQVERCQGAGCTNFGAAIGTPTISAFNDTGLTEGVTYRYRVSAGDAANNFSAYSSIVTVTPDVTPPTPAPAGLAATAISSTQINLSWTASTDNVGVASYQVERCPGSTCTNFGIVTSPTATTFSDTSGLAANTTYRYRVLAKDAAGNISTYSAIVSATTPSAPVAPTAVNDLFLYRSGVQRTADAPGPRGLGVLANDIDSASLPLNAVLVGTLPSTITLASNGVVTATISANTSFAYRANNGALSSLPITGSTVLLRANGTPVANADNCSYSVSANLGNGSIVSGSACAMTGISRTFTMNLTANDTDPNKTTNIPTDGVGDDITRSIITSTGTGVEVAANPACGQAAIVKTASRASIVNNCNGTLTITNRITVPPILPVSATLTYRVFDELGTQSGTRTNTISIQF